MTSLSENKYGMDVGFWVMHRNKILTLREELTAPRLPYVRSRIDSALESPLISSRDRLYPLLLSLASCIELFEADVISSANTLQKPLNQRILLKAMMYSAEENLKKYSGERYQTFFDEYTVFFNSYIKLLKHMEVQNSDNKYYAKFTAALINAFAQSLLAAQFIEEQKSVELFLTNFELLVVTHFEMYPHEVAGISSRLEFLK